MKLYLQISTQSIDPQGAYSFNCSCSEFHYGIYCENQVDVCANETCSNNGVCKNKNMAATCDCLLLLSNKNLHKNKLEKQTKNKRKIRLKKSILRGKQKFFIETFRENIWLLKKKIL